MHLAELGTTAVSGASHWRFGNVDWRTVRWMTFPGAVGAFLGAVVLSSLSGDTAKPWVAGHPQRARRLRAVPLPP